MEHNISYHLIQILLPFHWPRPYHVTCNQLPTTNCLLMRNVVQLCLAAINILLMQSLLRKNGSFPKNVRQTVLEKDGYRYMYAHIVFSYNEN